jgi:hypothetical protein
METPPKMIININLDNCPEIVCPCGGKEFAQLYKVRIMPAVYSPTGKTGTVNIAHAFACVLCGKAMDMQETIKDYEGRAGKIITMPTKGEETK